MIESSKKVKPWREAVKWAALENKLSCIPGPVKVHIAFTLPKPKGCPKTRFYPDKKPDLDKLLRSTLDALVEAGAIEDDARVIEVRAWKTFPGGPGSLAVPGACIFIVQTAAWSGSTGTTNAESDTEALASD